MANFDDELNLCSGGDEEAKDEGTEDSESNNNDNNNNNNSGNNVGNTGQSGNSGDGSPLRPQPNWGVGGLSVDTPNNPE